MEAVILFVSQKDRSGQPDGARKPLGKQKSRMRRRAQEK